MVRVGILAFLIFGTSLLAHATPSALTYQGRILNANGTPLQHTSVSFQFEITNPTGLCVIYREQVNGINMANSNGVFDVKIGASHSYPASGTFKLLDAFSNSATLTCDGGSTYNPTAFDGRLLRVSFYDGSSWRMISPDSTIRSVPYAAYSYAATKLGEYTSSDYVLKRDVNNGANCNGGSFLTWDAATNTFGCAVPSGGGGGGGGTGTVTGVSSMNSYLSVNNGTTTPELTINVGQVANTVAAGNDPRFTNARVPTGAAGGDLAGTYPNPTIAKIQGYGVDLSTAPTNGQVMTFDGASWTAQTLPMGNAGTVTSVTAGTGLTGGSITTSGTIGLGTELAGLNALGTNGYIYRSGAGTYGSNSATPLATNNTLVQRDGSGVSGFKGISLYGATSGIVTLQPQAISGSYSLQLPNAQGGTNQVMINNGSGVMSWADIPAAPAADCSAGSVLTYSSGNFTCVPDQVGSAGGGITGINGQSGSSQSLTIGTTGNLPNWVSGGDVHRLNIPLASASSSVTAGLISNAQYQALLAKQDALSYSFIPLNPANNLSDLANATTARTNLGLGTAAILDSGTTSGTIPLIGAGNKLAAALIPDLAATTITNTPAGTLTATTVQGALNELDTEKVSKSGDTMTGTLNLPSNGLKVGTSQLVVSGGAVGIGTASPSALLDLTSTSSGVLIPRMTTTQRDAIATPATGLQVYNTSTNQLNYYNGSAWQALGIAGAGLTNLNGLTASSQTFAVGTSGNAPAFSSATSTHTLNIPMASAGSSVTAGLISNAQYQTLLAKQDALSYSFIPLNPANNLSDLANVATARTNLGLGTAAVVNTGTTSGTLPLISTGNKLPAAIIPDLAGTTITNTPAGTIIATTVQAALNELDTDKVAKAGDTMTGTLNLPSNGLKVGTNQLIVSSGFVGIGTSAPTIPLAIVATPDITAGRHFLFGSNTGSANGQGEIDLGYYADGTNITTNMVHSGNNLPLSIFMGSSERMRITQAGNIGIGTSSPNALLDLTSTSAGVLIPRMTTTQRDAISTPATGLQVYNTSTNQLNYYNGSAWQALGVAGAGLTSLNGLTASTQSFAVGTSGTAPAFASATSTHTLNIPMASTASVTAGLISKTDYDNFSAKLGTASTFSGDVSGTYNATVVNKIKGTPVSAVPTSAGQVLRYDGTTNYVPSFLSLADIRSSVTPANTMFPTTTCTAAQTLTWSSLTDTMSCTTIGIAATQITSGTLAAARMPALTGDITTTAGTVATSITAAAVTTAKIADNAVTTAKINTGAVTANELASNAVTTGKIADANVTSAKLATGAALGNLGYTPVNKAGDTMTGALNVSSNITATGSISHDGTYYNNATPTGTATSYIGYQDTTNRGLQITSYGATHATSPNRSIIYGSYSGGSSSTGGSIDFNTPGDYLRLTPPGGASGALQFFSGGSITMSLSATGRVGIGTNDPSGVLDLTNNGGTGVSDDIKLMSYNGSDEPVLNIYHANGTQAAPTGLLTGDAVGKFNFAAHTGAGWVNASSIVTTVDNNWTTTASTQNSTLKFYTTTAGSSATRMVINGSGVGIGSTVPNEKLEVNGNAVIGGGHIYFNHDGDTNANNDFITYSDTNGQFATGNGGWFIVDSEKIRGTESWTTPTAGISAYVAFIKSAAGIGTTVNNGALTVNGNIMPDVTNGGTLGSSTFKWSNIYSTSANVSSSILIGTTTNNGPLTVNGNIMPDVNNGGNLGSATFKWNTVYATNGAINTSDQRLKTEIEDLKPGLDFILSLRPVRFKWRSETNTDDKAHWGLIAQEIKSSVDKYENEEAGIVGKNGGEFYGVNYSEMISPIIKSISELYQKWFVDHERINRLEKENLALKAKLESQSRDFEERLRRLESRQPAGQ